MDILKAASIFEKLAQSKQNGLNTLQETALANFVETLKGIGQAMSDQSVRDAFNVGQWQGSHKGNVERFTSILPQEVNNLTTQKDPNQVSKDLKYLVSNTSAFLVDIRKAFKDHGKQMPEQLKSKIDQEYQKAVAMLTRTFNINWDVAAYKPSPYGEDVIDKDQKAFDDIKRQLDQVRQHGGGSGSETSAMDVLKQPSVK